jgi:hypothetical protein
LHLNEKGKANAEISLNIHANMEIVYTDSIPQRATHVLIFKGDSITKITYTSEDFDNERPPLMLKIK